jgi:hypothetical protein
LHERRRQTFVRPLAAVWISGGHARLIRTKARFENDVEP